MFANLLSSALSSTSHYLWEVPHLYLVSFHRAASCSIKIKCITDWEGETFGQWDTRPFAGYLQWCRSNTDNQGTPRGHPLYTVLGSCIPAPHSSPPAPAPSPDIWRVCHSETASSPRCCWTCHPHTRHSSPPSTEHYNSQQSSTARGTQLARETSIGNWGPGIWM